MPTGTALLEAVQELTTMLASTTDEEESMRRALELCVKAVDAAGGTIFLHDKAERELCFFHAVGGRVGSGAPRVALGLVGARLADTEGIAGEVFQTQRAQITNNVQTDPSHAKRFDEEFQFETRSLLTVPLQNSGADPLGVLQVLNKRGGEFGAEDAAAIEILARVLTLALFLRRGGEPIRVATPRRPELIPIRPPSSGPAA